MPGSERHERGRGGKSGKKLLEDQRLWQLLQLSRKFHMPLGLLMQNMTHVELQYQLVLEYLDPSGEERADERVAQQTAAFVNTQIVDKHKKVSRKDFLLTEDLKKRRDVIAKKSGVKPRFDRKAFFKNIEEIVAT